MLPRNHTYFHLKISIRESNGKTGFGRLSMLSCQQIVLPSGSMKEMWEHHTSCSATERCPADCEPFFFFFIIVCINFPFAWFAVSRFVGCRGNKLWAFITSRLHSDQIQQCDKILGSCAIAVQQWESHLINIAGPLVCHQIVLCSCAIARRCPL